MPCAPQRYAANNTNELRAATLTPSSVLPVEDQVIQTPLARDGTAQVTLTGTYTGSEEATYDVEIVDDTIGGVALISAPVFTGEGSGGIEDIAATALPAQEITVELAELGITPLASAVDFEGVRVEARAIGSGGNLIHINVDQTALVYTATDFSTLEDLAVGAGGETTALKGEGLDWDTAVLGADNIIPASSTTNTLGENKAHRFVFEHDKSVVYLQFKYFKDGDWFYRFVPELKRDIPKGTRILFVTGGRTVTITDGITPDAPFTGIVTLYDILDAIKTSSALVDVKGVVANDRTPEGQAARDLQVRTDAHVGPSTGDGSASATGFVDTFANPTAATELVTAKCYAVDASDHPLASVGSERWEVRGSVSGLLPDAVTGTAYVDPGSKFGFLIPRKLPTGFGGRRGRFDVTGIEMPRDPPTEPPPVCVVAMTLGIAAADQQITLEWTKRPSGDCVCDRMAVPFIGGRCLGLTGEGGAEVGYQSDTVTRLVALYDWYADTVRDASSEQTVLSRQIGYQEPGITEPTPVGAAPSEGEQLRESLLDVVRSFEETIAAIDPVIDATPELYRAAGMAAWDTAVTEMMADVDSFIALSPPIYSIPFERYESRLRWALISAGLSPLGKTDASIVESGDGCWRDWGGDFWKVTGTLGEYAPAFNNKPYYSSRKAIDEGAYFTTKEFGFQINIKCEGDLVYGDRIILSIGDAGWPATYNVGDVLTLPIISARDLYLAGGRDGDNIERWYVSGSDYGAFAVFLRNAGSPTGYSDAGLAFDIVSGGVPFAKGDGWKFAIEGGHYRWRKNGGAWSASADIPAAPTALDAGLSVDFTTGASPSFAAGDLFSFAALQPWAASNLLTPTLEAWAWTGATPNIIWDAGTVRDFEGVVIGLHSLPSTSTLVFEGGTSPGVYTWSETLTWREGAIAKEFATTHAARYVRLTLTGATDGTIGWVWAGAFFKTRLTADIDLRRAYKINRSQNSGLNTRGLSLGKTISGTVEYTEGSLTEADAAGLQALLDHVKMNDDEPFVLIPQITRPDEVVLATVLSDEVEFGDVYRYGLNAGKERKFSAVLPLQGVWQ